MGQLNFGGGSGSSLFSSLFSSSQSAAKAQEKADWAGQIKHWDFLYTGGKMTGAQYAHNLQQIANNYKDDDPQQYWTLMQDAQTLLKKNPGLAGTGTGSSGGGSSSSSSSKAATANQTALVNQYKAIADGLKNLEDAYDAGAKVAPDPFHPGATITLNDATMKAVDAAYLKNFDGLTAAYKAGGYKDIALVGSTQAARAKFITGTIQKRNNTSFDEQERLLINSTNTAAQAASQMSDPYAASALMASIAKEWINHAQAASATVTTPSQNPVALRGQRTQIGADAGPTTTAKGQLDSTTTDRAAQAAAFAKYLAVIADPNASPADTQAAKSAAEAAYGGTLPANLQSMVTKFQGPANLASGVAGGHISPYQDAQGNTKYAPVVTKMGPVTGPDGSVVMGATQAPDIPTSKDQQVTTAYIDDSSGKPIPRQVVITHTDGGIKVWENGSAIKIGSTTIPAHTQLTTDQINSIIASNPDAWTNLVNSGGVKKVSGADLWVANLNGEQFYRDGAQGAWFKGAPPLSGTAAPGGAISAGSLVWPPQADSLGTSLLYAGDNNAAMQDVILKGQLTPDAASIVAHATGRDDQGQVSSTVNKNPNIMFDSSAQAATTGERKGNEMMAPGAGNVPLSVPTAGDNGNGVAPGTIGQFNPNSTAFGAGATGYDAMRQQGAMAAAGASDSYLRSLDRPMEALGITTGKKSGYPIAPPKVQGQDIALGRYQTPASIAALQGNTNTPPAAPPAAPAAAPKVTLPGATAPKKTAAAAPSVPGVKIKLPNLPDSAQYGGGTVGQQGPIAE